LRIVGTIDVRSIEYDAGLVLLQVRLRVGQRGRRRLWIQQRPIDRGALGRRDRGQALEVGARGVVEPHRRLPASQLVERRGQVQQRVVEARHRAVPGDGPCHETRPRRQLLGRLPRLTRDTRPPLTVIPPPACGIKD
jgi:hypothetical protein